MIHIFKKKLANYYLKTQYLWNRYCLQKYLNQN